MKYHYLFSKKKIKASLTIEASYVFPIVIVTICMVIVLSFFLHDKVISNSLAYRDLLYKKSDCISSNYSSYSDNELRLLIEQSAIAFGHIKVKASDANTILLTFYNNNTKHFYSDYQPCKKARIQLLLKQINN